MATSPPCSAAPFPWERLPSGTRRRGCSPYTFGRSAQAQLGLGALFRPGPGSSSGSGSVERRRDHLRTRRPRVVYNGKRNSSPRSPSNSSEIFTPAHEENVRFIYEAFKPVDLSDLKRRNTQDAKKS
ncbi:hypothetical protein JD844_011456 [Phrynosoma platyrhinos]|uniref:MAPK regulated corepressor interacting protein 1 n=1 Tax=Phrynosoma platyrhinos TaxID=52577 RepID=A0ABQ7TIV4_PHRPL|nr:hypothetical protein JD844_011456 [Phrynosoma platyrhinos]